MVPDFVRTRCVLGNAVPRFLERWDGRRRIVRGNRMSETDLVVVTDDGADEKADHRHGSHHSDDIMVPSPTTRYAAHRNEN